MLLKKAHHQLNAAGDTYNKAIYERLLMIEQLFMDSTQFSDESHLPEIGSQFKQRFRNLAIVLSDDQVMNLYGTLYLTEKISLTASELRHLSLERSIIKMQKAGTETKLLFLKALHVDAPEKGIVIAEIVSDYVWGDPSAFAYNLEQCVLSNQYVTLFCAHQSDISLKKEFIEPITQEIKGEFDWYSNHEHYIANYHEVFLDAHFMTPRWLVVSMQSKADAIGNTSNLNTIFWGSVGLSILLIMLFSMIQIRRILVPLEKLIEGTRRLGNHDFSSHIDVISSDEFGELATSFNTMTTQVGEQFEMLTALSRIDQEILSGLNIDKIVYLTLIHMNKIVKADVVSITVLDPDDAGKGYVYELAIKDHSVMTADCKVLDSIQQLLQNHSKGMWIDCTALQQLPLEELSREGQGKNLACSFLLPLNWNHQLVGYVLLGFVHALSRSQENIQYINDYADRVAVALFTKNREELLLRQVRIDALTGLPNRFLFMEQLQKEIAQSQRGERKLAVLYVDFDRFKMVNDSYGHAIGDELLCEAGERFLQCIDAGDTAARLGGDEFAVIVCDLDSSQAIQSIAQKIILGLAEPYFFRGEQNILTVSIGIAVYPQDGANTADLMRNSDIALYRAKANGGNQFVFFEESMNTEISKRLMIEREMRKAVSEQQFVLHYQPQVDPKTNRVRGVETLVRWNHPELGFVPPGVFIPIAEDTGLIIDIGRIVLDGACRQYREWINQGICLDYVAVNVSVKQFRQPDFFQMVESVLKRNELDPHCLELEITESDFMEDMQEVLRMLEKLKHLGIQLSIDDFGTGYSSMSYLEQLPFDTLKIDISFVRKINENGEGGTIAATIAAMAHTLDKRIVAEGVENQAQLEFLKKYDCELIQGYFYCRPVPADELANFVAQNHAKNAHFIPSHHPHSQPIRLVSNAPS
ncbi:MAG: EAL domain-containing protein [Nitrosomonas sp.]|nr:EAL domain-containing protein [Nitrosomonas sp.]